MRLAVAGRGRRIAATPQGCAIRCLLLGLLCLFGTVTAPAAKTVYVATNGDDANAANNCQAAVVLTTPARNPATAASCLAPGDTLHIRAGTYNVGLWSGPPSGNSSARVTVAGYPQDGQLQAILNFFGDGNGLGLSNKSWITFDNLVFDGSGVTSAVIKLTTSTNMQFLNGEVRKGGQGLKDGPTDGNQGFLLVTNSNNNLIRNMSIHDNGNSSLVHGIYSASRDNIFENNDIYKHTGFGIHNYNGNSGAGNENNISRGNRLHDNAIGLLMGDGGGQKGYNNLIYGNHAWAIQSNGGSGNLLLNNTIYGNTENAFNIDNDTLICNNIATQNGNNSVPSSNGGNSSNQTGSQSFVNAGAGDFHLQSGSAAINQGTSGCQVSSLVTTDFYGNTRPVGGFWDVGAAEFGGTGATCPPTCTCTVTPGVCDCPATCTCTVTPGVCDVTPPAPGLQAYWPFDHSSGTTATDVTAGAHTMTFTGGPSWVPGRVGSNAIEFTNTTQVGMASSFDLTATYSWAGWFKMRTVPRTDVFEICLRYGGSAGDQFEWVWSSPVANGSQAATHRNSSGAYQRARLTTPLAADTWYHVAATWNGTTLIAYLNGTQQASTAVSGMNPGGDNTFQTSLSGSACPGAIDDLRLYNTVLTPAEVQTLAGTTAPAAVIVRHRALVR